MPPAAIDMALVASWFPSLADPVAGRFVADQAAALAATDRVRPAVVSFDPAALSGSQRDRARLAGLVLEHARTAIAGRAGVFAAFGWAGPPGIPVARLPVPEGRTAADPVLHALHARQAVLEALASRWLDGTTGATLPARPTLVHAHTGYPDGAAAATLADRLDAPLLITEHASFLAALFARPGVREAYLTGARRAARLLAVSEMLASELRTALPEVAERIVVVPNSIPVHAFAAEPTTDERRVGELLYVGHRTEAKGIPLLLAALVRVRRDRPGVTLRLIGRAPLAALDERWRRLAAELGVADAVTFEPEADRAAVAAAMARAAVFVHASRRETFGVVVAEALAAGLPVVATDSGGASEILGPEPASLGALVPSDDPDALAAAISAVLDRWTSFDPTVGRARVVARYGATAVAGRLVELYETVLAEHRSGLRDRTRATPRAAAGSIEMGAGSVAPDAGPTILLALDPDRAGLAEALPAASRRAVVVVTARSPGRHRPGPADGVTVAIGGLTRTSSDTAALASTPLGRSRLAAALRHPLATSRRRGLLPGTFRWVELRGRRGLRIALDRGGGPVVVCADGFDHLAADSEARAGRVLIAPGGLRWLADHALEQSD